MFRQLPLRNRMQAAISIEQFLSPAGEVIIDNYDSLLVSVLEEIIQQLDHKSDEEMEVILKMTLGEVFSHPQALRIYEAQQPDGQQLAINHLNWCEELLIQQWREN
ncbi:hypothetical protein K431DRAFT_286882 [Polychaeton citri CBS 116435]|uniref:Uncharacterized protein n=1 Tax=Polychaeton citri CBS 116435 TaxID=1314669 RepID=A0A9P4UMZ8_9PEZI|nr:hypothetical protein K431DRAFT_286882 [Polychaeton citri CBS 116435]